MVLIALAVPTSALPDSSIGDSHSMVAGGTDMPHNDISQEFYQNMLVRVFNHSYNIIIFSILRLMYKSFYKHHTK